MNTAILIIVAVFIGLWLFARRQTRRPAVSKDAIIAELQKGGVLVDVRSKQEFASGHAKNAKNVPLTLIQSGGFPIKDKQKTVYVYCHSGARAAVAQSILRKAGFSNVTNIGSLRYWQKIGGEVTN